MKVLPDHVHDSSGRPSGLNKLQSQEQSIRSHVVNYYPIYFHILVLQFYTRIHLSLMSLCLICWTEHSNCISTDCWYPFSFEKRD